MKSNILFDFYNELQTITIKVQDYNLKVEAEFGEIVMPPKNYVYSCSEIDFHLPSEHLLGKITILKKIERFMEKFRWKEV
jgi:carbonic anhydrase